MEFPTLFGEASTGKRKVWSVKVVKNASTATIVTSHGYDGGKIVVNDKEVSVGKNIGKKNETTAYEQACLDARALWQKKKDAGYVDESASVPAAAGAGSGSAGLTESRAKISSDEVPAPMLALDFNKRGKSIAFPCYIQRKYDGTRCVGIPNIGLFSRNRKSYPHMKHIVAEINKLPPAIILDGELYSDTLTFQEIVGLVKRETLKTGDDEKQLQIKFHIYDIVNGMPYEQRYANLQMLFSRYKFKYLELVKTDVCESEEKMKELHAQYVAEGYEGIMLRNKSGLYKNARSADLQKYKEFFDDEYEVVGYKEGEGVEEGCVLWVCKTPEGKTFNCRPRGTREDRAEMYLNGDKYVGKKLTVRFQELTDDKVPRFPVGIAFRDYE
jgi:ATP-dependent DNA ligase